MPSLAWIARLLVVAALVLSSCGDDGGAGSGHQPSSASDGTEMGGMDHEESSEVVHGAREIEVHATSFEFDPSEITIEAGEDVAIALTSEDVLHDFEVEGADGHVSAEAGETGVGGFRIDDAGTYTFFCSVEGHRDEGMEGTLTVE